MTSIFLCSCFSFTGQPLGIVVATSAKIAQRAAYQVEVIYEEENPVLSIQEAKEAKSFFPAVLNVNVGNVEDAVQNSKTVVEGSIDIGGQEHFYFEPMNSVAIPQDGDQLIVHSSTQNGHKSQYFTASGLGLKANQVVSRTSRIGGGFGGKETRSIPFSLYSGLAALKLKRPARITLPRDVDMSITGTRHPFRGEYKVGADEKGKIMGADLKLFANGGCSHDLSYPVLGRAVLFSDGAYHIPNIKIEGKVCKTNLPSNTGSFQSF